MAQAPASSAIRFSVHPRLVPAAKAARRLHLTLDEFRAKISALRLEGFPSPCPVTGHFDLVAIDTWMDKRAGLAGRAATLEEDHDATIRARLKAYG